MIFAVDGTGALLSRHPFEGLFVAAIARCGFCTRVRMRVYKCATGVGRRTTQAPIHMSGHLAWLDRTMTERRDQIHTKRVGHARQKGGMRFECAVDDHLWPPSCSQSGNGPTIRRQRQHAARALTLIRVKTARLRAVTGDFLGVCLKTEQRRVAVRLWRARTPPSRPHD